MIPTVGMGATICWFTDRTACTVIFANATTVVVQEDWSTRTDTNGMSESQEYEYKADPNGARYTFTLRKNGAWVRKGDPMNGLRLSLGVRRSYYDFSF